MMQDSEQLGTPQLEGPAPFYYRHLYCDKIAILDFTALIESQDAILHVFFMFR